jgi:YfiH family protein
MALKLAFPDFTWSRMKQTHSNIVLQAPFEGAPEGDAQITRQHLLAISVRTADCVPVMIHDPESGQIAAIHAGWRGIENEIIRTTGASLMKRAQSLKSAFAWIGPHIAVESFEVGLDVAEKLENRFQAVRSFSPHATALQAHEHPEKKRVDLLRIAHAQLASIGIEPERIRVLAINTFTSPGHESFRRDKATAGRQLSFIALK